MAWVEPPTWTAAIVTVGDMNIQAEDLRYLKGQTDQLAASAVKLNRTSAQSIPDNTWTAVTWNNQLSDIGGYWSSGTNITIPSDFPAGVTTYFFLVNVVGVFAANGTGARGIRTLLGGVVVEQYSFDAETTGATTMAVPTSIPDGAEAGIITMEVFQDSGAALNLTGAVITVIRLFPSG